MAGISCLPLSDNSWQRELHMQERLLVRHPAGRPLITVVPSRSRKSFNAVRVVLLLGSIFSGSVAGFSNEPSDPRLAVTELYRILTNQLPTRLRILAEVEEREPPWTEVQVREALRREEKDLEENDRPLSQGERSELRTVRLNGIRANHSGTRRFRLQEWLSGRLYRLDQTDHAVISAQDLEKMDASFHETFVNIDDPGFSDVSSFTANHQLKSAMLSKRQDSKYARADLWAAGSLDGVFARLLGFTLVDINSLMTNVNLSPYNEFTGAQMDMEKLDALLSGKTAGLSVLSEEISENGMPMIRLAYTAKVPSLTSAGTNAVQASFYLARTNQRVVCVKAQYDDLTFNTSYFCRREAFDSNGFPRFWYFRSVDRSGAYLEKTVRIVELDWAPVLADAVIFAPRFPSDYLVSDVSSGIGVVVQDPHPERKIGAIGPPPRVTWLRVSYVLLIAALLMAPIIVLVARRKQV